MEIENGFLDVFGKLEDPRRPKKRTSEIVSDGRNSVCHAM
jgi:hypothetical protein